MTTSVVNSRFLFIEFSPETMTGLVMYDKIEKQKLLQTEVNFPQQQFSWETSVI